MLIEPITLLVNSARRYFMVFTIALSTMHLTSIANGDPGEVSENRKRHREAHPELYSVDFGVALWHKVNTELLVPITFADLPPNVQRSVYGRPEMFFIDSARLVDRRIVDVPFSEKNRDGMDTASFVRPQDLKMAVYAALNPKEIDIVRYSWSFRGQKITMLARQDASRLDLDLRDVANNPALDEYGPNLRDRAIGYLSSLLRLEGETRTFRRFTYKLDIPWPTSFDDGVKFSSNPDQCITAMDSYRWFERVDGYIHEDTLSLLFYMKPGQLMGFRDGSKWFPDDFRAWIHEQARLQGRLPEPDDSE